MPVRRVSWDMLITSVLSVLLGVMVNLLSVEASP